MITLTSNFPSITSYIYPQSVNLEDDCPGEPWNSPAYPGPYPSLESLCPLTVGIHPTLTFQSTKEISVKVEISIVLYTATVCPLCVGVFLANRIDLKKKFTKQDWGFCKANFICQRHIWRPFSLKLGTHSFQICLSAHVT